MRFACLDLIRFGRFAGSHLDIPDTRPDFHIVAGRNEAGKTTAMAAIEDLLFGFPARTPYAFRYGYDELRVGAVLESDGERLVVRRRKGNRDTLLDKTDTATPGGEATLNRFLGATDREFFLRMFSLSHDRLAQGGREIAAAEGEVGETLFAAGAALRGLRARRKGLDSEAAALWTPRRAKTRRFYRASDRFTEVDRALRQGTKRPEEWKSLRRERDTAQRLQQELEEDYRQAAAESRRCSRIRRVLPTVRRLSDLEEECASLGNGVPLPEDAASRLAQSKSEAARAAAEAGFHQQSLEAKRRDRESVPLDQAFQERQSALRELEDIRVKVAQMRLDLPKRKGERDVALRALRQAASDFGWETGPDESLLERVPSGRQLARLNGLLQRRGALIEAERAAGTALSDSERRVNDQRSRVSAGRRAEEAARLEAVVRANASAEDCDVRVRDLRRDREELREQVLGLRVGLSPALPENVSNEATLRALSAPGAQEVARSRDRFRDLDEKLEDVRRRVADARRQLRGDQDRYRNLERAASGITRSSLDRARAGRDAVWDEVRTRLLDKSASGSPESLVARFETLTRDADAVTDRRFEGAEMAGRLAATEAAIGDREASLRALVAEENEFDEHRERLAAAWRSLWDGCPFAPLPPDRMAVWIERRDELASAYQLLGRKERDLTALQAEEQEIRGQLTSALLPFGVSPPELDENPLKVILRRAEALLQEERHADRQEKDARAARAKAEQERSREQDRLARARADTAAWNSEWSEALIEAGLDPIAPSEAKASLLTDMREFANTVRDIQMNRIATMEREIDRFEELVCGLVSALAPEIADVPADEAALRLRDRLSGELDRRKERRELDREIAKLEDAIRERQAAGARSEAELAPLYELAGTADREALQAAIERSDRKRDLERERAELVERLAREADGLSLSEVRAECEGVGHDEAIGREKVAESGLEEITAERNRLAERLGETRKELEAFADDDAAARLAANREEALAAVREAAERYARVRTAEILLRWALEKFRKDKQGPMLRRAGSLFRILTGGSFVSLEVGFDVKDQLRLDAVRGGGEVVQVSGLSSGSEDQLYLALRIAAIEDYVKRAPALPFVADDLFVNFDEARAAAGFRILGDFAKSTQVLFFTHHEHLVGIAREVLGEDVPVVRLDEA